MKGGQPGLTFTPSYFTARSLGGAVSTGMVPEFTRSHLVAAGRDTGPLVYCVGLSLDSESREVNALRVTALGSDTVITAISEAAGR